jgi:hydroxyacylglutathione hydrolase
MFLKRIESKGIAHFSYLIGSGKEAAVIDPRRDCRIYPREAGLRDAGIMAIFETHRHEDFVSGGPELSRITGAEVYHGRNLDFSFGKGVVDGESIQVGEVFLDIIETPGHTDESISIAVREEERGKPLLVFTGDTLFYGDVGRTDLYGPDKRLRNAENIYTSLHDRILPLGDGVIVLPAHGKGSVCGDRIDEREWSTIGYEKARNRLLKMSKEDFLVFKSAEELEVPRYFSMMEVFNKNGPPLSEDPIKAKPLDLRGFLELRASGAQVLDIRRPLAFASGHIPGSLNIWKEGIPSFAGWFLDYDEPVILVGPDGKSGPQAARYLHRLGFDRTVGYLAGGMDSYVMSGKEMVYVETWTADNFHKIPPDKRPFLLDVRDASSWGRKGHIEDAVRIYVGELPDRMKDIPEDSEIMIYCDSGYKTSIASSILLRSGRCRIRNLLGGIEAWKSAGHPVIGDK